MTIQDLSTELNDLKNQISDNQSKVSKINKRLSLIAVIVPLITVVISGGISYLSTQSSTKISSDSNVKMSETSSKTDLSKDMLTFTRDVLLMSNISDEEKKILLERQLIAYIHLIPQYEKNGQIFMDSVKIEAITNSSEMLKEMFKNTNRRYVRGYVIDPLKNVNITGAEVVLEVSCKEKITKIGEDRTNEQGYFSIDIDESAYCEDESFTLTTTHSQYHTNSSVFETLLVNRIALDKK